MRECWVVDLGLIDYDEASALQEKLVELRGRNKLPDILLLLEHPHVVTIGRRGAEGDLKISRRELEEKGIKVRNVNRGGKVTYHGPGQIIGYAIRKISHDGLDSHLNGLEDTMIEIADSYDVVLSRSYEVDPIKKRRYVGAWYSDAGKEFKLGAVGIRLNRENRVNVTEHGFAMYVNTDLGYFDLIIPCGFTDKGVTSLAQLLRRQIDMNDAKQRAAKAFTGIFGYEEVTEKSYEELKGLLQSEQ